LAALYPFTEAIGCDWIMAVDDWGDEKFDAAYAKL
jgi:hypothetical protein